MMFQIKRWLSPPAFQDDETKTRRASLLNAALLVNVAVTFITCIGNLLGGRTPAAVTGSDILLIVVCLILRRAMRQGNVHSTSVTLIGLDLLAVTVLVAGLGTFGRPPRPVIY